VLARDEKGTPTMSFACSFSRVRSIVEGRSLLHLVALGAAIFATACATSQMGATDADLARAKDQTAQGASSFSAECAQCHGQHGEGLGGAPPILGAGALPEFPRDNSLSGSANYQDPQQLQIQQQTRPAGAPRRDPFRTAQDLYAYVSVHLPKSRAAAMKTDDYWGIVTFLLAAEGTTVPQGGVNANNASSVSIQRH
jgi:cytochrome c553